MISVVIPALNAAATLVQTLTSLIAQTHVGWEAIVVDDGSTDETPEIAAHSAANDVRIRLTRQANAGLAGARNTGLHLATGEWVTFLDADDWLDASYLERLLHRLDIDPRLDAVFCKYARVALDGALVVDDYEPPEGDLFPVLARRSAFPVHACIARTLLVRDAGGFDTTFRSCEDWDLWQRLARAGARFGAVREVLAFYRMTPNSISHDARRVLADGLRVLRTGHGPDPRVAHPSPLHAAGQPPEHVSTQLYYLLAWAAGVSIGQGRATEDLVALAGDSGYPELSPAAIAQCLFDSVPLPRCQGPGSWPELLPAVIDRVDSFLQQLESSSRAPGVARQARSHLMEKSLRQSPLWSPLLVELDGSVHRVQNELSESVRERDHLRDQVQHLVDEAIADRRRLDEMHVLNQSELAALRSAIDESVLARRGVEERLEIVERSRSELEDRLEGAERSRSQLEQRLDTVERSRSELENRLEAAERSRSEVENRLETVERSRSELEHGLQAIGSENARLSETLNERQLELDDSRRNLSALRQVNAELRYAVAARTTERDAIQRSAEQRLGDWLLNRLRLRVPIDSGNRVRLILAQRWSMARLAFHRLRGTPEGQFRVLTSVVDVFPVYSQTFVYEELSQLARSGFDIRLVYSRLDSREHLRPQFDHLWTRKRRLHLSDHVHHADLAHYRRRMPARVHQVIQLISEGSGMEPASVVRHGNVLQAFSFARMAEAYRPDYLHTYFFYDRTLMALVAGYLLDIPRGVSCYSDHLLKDYELKLVPLHLSLCHVIIATSARIREELLEIAPATDPSRILVKPNGVDTNAFPVVDRADPGIGAPFRIVSICRIEPKKGLVELVEAVHLARQRGLNVEAHIVGATDEWSEASRAYKTRLDERITELGLWGAVHLEGRQQLAGVKRFLSISQLFVAPFVETETGDKDGIPTALLEAMATGIPVVATDAGSITEVVRHDHEGLIVPQRDVSALADAIEASLLDPGMRARHGASSAARIREVFDSSRCERAFHDRVRAVVAAHRAQAVP